MFGSSILDVAIGMAVVYLILSLIASVIQEAIAAVLQSRSANLLQGIHSLFSGDTGPNGQSLLTALYDHGLIRGLYRDPIQDSSGGSDKSSGDEPTKGVAAETDKDPKNKKAFRRFDGIRMKLQQKLGLAPPQAAIAWQRNLMLLPAYIPSRTFALALVDILDPAESGSETSLDRLRAALAAAVNKDKGNKALQALSALADSAGNDLAEFQRRIEDWYNDAMDRISGWYKKYTQNVLMAIGLVIAIAFNVSSIHVAKTLWTDKDARDAMVTMAQKYRNDGNPEGPQSTQGAGASQGLEKKLLERIQAMQDVTDQKLLPIGWTENPLAQKKGWVLIGQLMLLVVGWCVTALALSLGASFWFDTLNKFMIIRGTIKPDEKSQPEASKG